MDACTEEILRTVPTPAEAEDVEFAPEGATVYTADSFQTRSRC